MASFNIQWKPSAIKELRRLDKTIIPRIIKTVESLANDPRPHLARKLQGSQTSYRVRVGDYRIIYSIFDKELVIEIIRVGHRRDVYER